MQRKRGLSLNHKAETLFAKETFVKKAAFGLHENKTRVVSDPPKRKKVKGTKDIRQLKKLASEMSRFMQRLTFISFLWTQIIFAAEIFVIRFAKA